MPFNSILFLFLFLPSVLGVYYIVPRVLKNVVLLLFSLFFYIWGDQLYLFVLLYHIFANYQCGLLIDEGKRKLGLTISLTLNLLLLGFFKYYNFAFEGFHALLALFNLHWPYVEAIPELAAPIGISFYTFKSISYTLDVYHAKVKASRSFIEFATFLAMFPPLLAGPIVRYVEIRQQLINPRISLSNFSDGVERFIIGLSKKMLIANTFAMIANDVFSTNLMELSSAMAWVGVIAFTIQIYYDFSGYSDMAIGLGKMFGFDFPENFNYPYISRNIREFWTRWHITLSSWLRDYLFLPLAFSLSRKLKKERYLDIRADHLIYMVAIFITFLTCGLWHGAAWHYIVWGGWFGIFIGIEHVGFGRILKRSWRPLQHLYTLVVVVFGWVIFRSESLSQTLDFFKLLFSFSAGNVPRNSYLGFFSLNRESYFFAMIALLFSMPAYRYLGDYFNQVAGDRIWLRVTGRMTTILVLIVLLMVSVSYIAAGTFNPFIYARF